MRNYRAAQLAKFAGAKIVGDGDVEVGPDVVIDSRQATPGCLFVAFPGEHVDGADFAPAAIQAGAAAVLSHRDLEVDVPVLVADDPTQALTRIGQAVVADSGQLTVIGLTGSSGKTTTKDILGQILSLDGPTVAPAGSLNNEIGVPLTACKVDDSTRYLVAEMGARGIGHIRWLCGIVPPQISMVINVGHAHIGEFGSQEVIAQAKSEIVECLGADGIAVLNADDPLVAQMSAKARARVFWFGFGIPDDYAHVQETPGTVLVQAVDITADPYQRPRFTLVIHRVSETGWESQSYPIALKLIGSHMVVDSMAAVAAALAAGVAPETAAAGLNGARTQSRMRMDLIELANGAAILDDSYNANPDSMAAALRTVGEMKAAPAPKEATPAVNRLIAVLGDMLELGPDAPGYHLRVGELAAEAGCDQVIAVGEYAADIISGVGDRADAVIAGDVEQAAALIDLEPNDLVLIKASRGLALDRVARRLEARYGRSGQLSDDPTISASADGSANPTVTAGVHPGESR